MNIDFIKTLYRLTCVDTYNRISRAFTKAKDLCSGDVVVQEKPNTTKLSKSGIKELKREERILKERKRIKEILDFANNEIKEWKGVVDKFKKLEENTYL